jgi:hypothetical protein
VPVFEVVVTVKVEADSKEAAINYIEDAVNSKNIIELVDSEAEEVA